MSKIGLALQFMEEMEKAKKEIKKMPTEELWKPSYEPKDLSI